MKPPAIARAHPMSARAAREYAAEQELVAEVAARAAGARTPAELTAALVESLRAFVPEPHAVYGFVDGDSIEWQVHGAWLLPTGPVSPAFFDSGQQVSYEPFGYERNADSAPWHGKALPLVMSAAHSEGRVSGALAVWSLEAGHSFCERDVSLLRLVAQIAGPAMENARAAEQAARERSLYDLALSSLSEAVMLFDHSLKLAFCNAAGRRVVADSFRPGESLADSVSRFNPSLQEGLRDALNGKRARGTGTPRIDGELRTFEYEAIPLTHPDYRLLIVGTDITEREQREAAEREHRAALEAAVLVAEQRSLYEVIINTLSEAVILVDEGANVVVSNALAERVLEAIDPAHKSHTLLETVAFLPPEITANLMNALGDLRTARGRVQIAVEGEVRWFDYEFIPLQAPGLRLLAVAADVTSVVEREEERERNRSQMDQAARLAALGELIGGVAHELNNPLTAILGFAEMLTIAPGASAFSEELTIIHKEAMRARDIVRDLLFIARPGPVDHGEVRLGDVVGHIERLRRSEWIRERIEVSTRLDPDMPALWGNEHQLTQVLLNIVTNAECAVAGGDSPAITIEAAVSAEGATVTVSDNGRGMDKAVQARIFEPFFTGRPGIGTGLGLSLSLSMVAAHQGRIEVDSAPGVGTAFRVILPAMAAPARPTRARIPVPGRRLRVLVVDDEPSLRNVARRLITRLGHDCETVGTSAEVAEVVATRDFDLVLCDYRLATETADEVLATLDAKAAQLIHRTVLATGAMTDRGVMALRERYGLSVVAKPYGIEELRQILATAAGVAAR